MIDLRYTSTLQYILWRMQGFFFSTIHLQSHKIVWDSVRKLVYNILREILARRKSLS